MGKRNPLETVEDTQAITTTRACVRILDMRPSLAFAVALVFTALLLNAGYQSDLTNGYMQLASVASLNTPEARDAKRASDLKTIQTALQQYYAAHGSYPSDFGSYVWIDENFVGRPTCATSTGGLKPYLADVCTLVDPLGLPLAYAYAKKPDGMYKLGAAFETPAARGTVFTYYEDSITKPGYFEVAPSYQGPPGPLPPVAQLCEPNIYPSENFVAEAQAALNRGASLCLSAGDFVLGTTGLVVDGSIRRFTSDSSITRNGVSSALPEWKIKTVADINNDKKIDLIWQHDNGTPAAWLGNGSANFPSSGDKDITLRSVSQQNAAWKIKAAGDVNGDGKVDLIWQHDGGGVGVWWGKGSTDFDGSDVITRLSVANTLAAWKVKAAGDVNGDGKVDLIWQHDGGGVGVWYGTGSANFGGTADFTRDGLANSESAWKVVGAADIDGDNKIDLVFQHNDGPAIVWYGTNGKDFKTGPDLVRNGVANTLRDWKIKAASDLDDDNDVDVVWQHDGGSVGVWWANAATASHNDLSIMGAGAGQTRLRYSGCSIAITLKGTLPNLTLSSFSLIGTATSYLVATPSVTCRQQMGISAIDGAHIVGARIQNLTLQNLRSGIGFFGGCRKPYPFGSKCYCTGPHCAANNVIEDNTVRDIYATAYEYEPGLWTDQSTGTAIGTQNEVNLIIRNNTTDNVSRHSIYVAGYDKNSYRIENNTIKNHRATGLDIAVPPDAVRFASAITIARSQNARVIGNTIIDSRNGGISVEDGYLPLENGQYEYIEGGDVHISNNTFSGGQGANIWIAAKGPVYISGNVNTTGPLTCLSGDYPTASGSCTESNIHFSAVTRPLVNFATAITALLSFFTDSDD